VKTKIELLKGDITQVQVDVIVNAANTTLLGGGGVDGAIHRAAGPKLLLECMKLFGCETGKAKITKGYSLRARYVIHTPGPVWRGGKNNERELLASCYRNSMTLAKEYSLRTVAFPSISTGVYSFPINEASKISYNTVKTFLEENPDSFDKVIFVLFSDEAFDVYRGFVKEK